LYADLQVRTRTLRKLLHSGVIVCFHSFTSTTELSEPWAFGTLLQARGS
jgi:hypothetical protein